MFSCRDAILCTQDKSIHEHYQDEMKRDFRVDTSETPTVDSDIASPSVSEGSSAALRSRLGCDVDRDLPPLPPLKIFTPTRQIHPHDSASRSEEMPITTTPTSRTSPGSPSPSRRQSPSILNLGQRSVVKQRLAEIQTNFETPAPSPTSTSGLSSPSRMSSPSRRSTGKRRALRTPTVTERMNSDSSENGNSAGNSADRLTSPVSAISDYSGLTTPRPKSAFRMRDEMRAMEKSGHRRWAAESEATEFRSMKRTTTDQSSVAERTVIQPSARDGASVVLDALDLHEERYHEHASVIGGQISALYGDVQGISEGIQLALSQRGEDSVQIAEMKSILQTVGNAVTHKHPTDLTANVGSGTGSEGTQVMEALDDIRSRMQDHFPALLRALEEIRPGARPSSTILRNVSPSLSETQSSTDTSATSEKLDALLNSFKELEATRFAQGEVCHCTAIFPRNRSQTSNQGSIGLWAQNS